MTVSPAPAARKALFSVKMRASRAGVHISGAERIVPVDDVAEVCAAMSARALAHPKGTPDAVNVSVAELVPEDIVRIPALPVTALAPGDVASPEDARAVVLRELEGATPHAALAWQVLTEVRDMRGAVLMDAVTGARLEPDPQRGVRVTNMDAAPDPEDAAGGEAGGKARVTEALTLASKVASHPAVLAEVCISDDPDYTTGYLATAERGYLRIPNMKRAGSPIGGRVFVVDVSSGAGNSAVGLAELIHYLEHTPVLVGGGAR